MATKLRVGLASLVHDHVWGELPRWMAHPDIEVVAVGEARQELREKAAKAGVPRQYSSWEEMIEQEPLDIVQAASENSLCADIIEAAMAKGAHVLSEKPMAATLAQANRMVAAAKRHDRLLMINWPNVWDPVFQEWERQVANGAVGRITHLRRRNSHAGPREIGCDPNFVEWLYDAERNGAGALMDYCCYGADIAARFLGLPNRVTGIRAVLVKEYPVPDDNAIILMQYEQAFAHTEASWTDVGYPPVPGTIAYGTEGACFIQGDKVMVCRAGEEAKTITPQPLVAPLRNAPEYFMHCLQTGAPIEGFCSMEVSRDAQEILEAGLRSSNEGQHMQLPL